MEITEHDIEVTARVMWNNTAEAADKYPEEAFGDFNRLAIKYGALSLLFCGRYRETELLLDWLKEAARDMASYYYNKCRRVA